MGSIEWDRSHLDRPGSWDVSLLVFLTFYFRLRRRNVQKNGLKKSWCWTANYAIIATRCLSLMLSFWKNQGWTLPSLKICWIIRNAWAQRSWIPKLHWTLSDIRISNFTWFPFDKFSLLFGHLLSYRHFSLWDLSY